MFRVLAVCALLVASASSFIIINDATDIPFTTCGTGDIVPKSIQASPWPPVRGQDLTITASGSLAKAVSAGNFELDVSYDGIQLIQKTGDVCTFSPSFTCPQSEGDVTITYTANVPSIAPAGSYVVQLKATRPDSSLLVCAQVAFEFDAEELQSNEIQTSVPFSSCATGTFTASDLDLSPLPVQAGSPVNVVAKGNLAQDLLGGTFEIDVSLSGITVLTQSGDICKFSPDLPCPTKAGDAKISYSLAVPSYAPAGDYVATVKAFNADKSTITCLSIPLTVQTETEGLAHPKSIIDTVNNAKTTWTAGPSKRFIDMPMSHVKKLCGALAGGPKLPVKVFAETFMNSVSVPASFDSRTEWGSKCPSLSEIRDQGACGSCWAVAAAAAMTDRLCINSQASSLFRLSAQDLVSCCGWSCGMGCDGGYPSGAWDYFTSNGLVTGGQYGSNQGCYPYQIANCSHHVSGSLPACGAEEDTPSCSSSCTNGAEWVSDKHKGVSSYGVSSSVSAIQTEIMQNGPVEAAFTVYADFPSYKSGVYQHTTGSALGGHAVKIIGWGAESGTNYWLVANSWNSEWGDQGYFKIKRGNDECGIESGIVAGIAA